MEILVAGDPTGTLILVEKRRPLILWHHICRRAKSPRHQRELAMSQFESGEMSAIVVTDVKFRKAGEWFSFLFILLRETDTFIKHLFHSRSTPYH